MYLCLRTVHINCNGEEVKNKTIDREDKILVYLICMRSSLPWKGIANRGCPGENCLSEHQAPADLEIFCLKGACMNTWLVKGIHD